MLNIARINRLDKILNIISNLTNNTFRQKIEDKQFIVSVEINPDKKADLQKNLREAALCAPFVDVLNVTDSSMAKMRPAGFVIAALLRRKFDLEVIFNFTCRDRNLIALKSDLLGALVLDAVNVLALTGDPPIKGDHPNSKPVYELNSLQLLKVITELNPRFFPGAVLNFSGSLEVISKVAAKKQAAGAEYLISQPVYSEHRIDFLAELQEKLGLPILAGVLPIKNRKMAEYLQTQVTGITIPEDDYGIMQSGISDEEIFIRQLELAARLTDKIRKVKLAGVHLMPMGRGDKVPQILNYQHS